MASRQLPPALSRDDLLQEALAHWWRARGDYDGARGASPTTFMRRVLRAKLLDIERGPRAGKRGRGVAPLSLDQPPGDGGKKGSSLGAVLPQRNPNADPEEAARRQALREHIQRVGSLLTARQRRLLDGLDDGESMSELSQSLRVPRPTLYDELRRIRDVFRDKGLEEYLH